MTRNLLAVAALLTISGAVAATNRNSSGSAPPACRVQGVWVAERVTTNGKQDPTTGQERKIMTKNHFMWVQQENRRDTLPLKTYRDSVRVFSDAAGYGSYTVSGTTVTEHIELFPNPTWIGRDFKATCSTPDRNHWIHTWYTDVYKDSTGRSRRDTINEYFARVE